MLFPVRVTRASVFIFLLFTFGPVSKVCLSMEDTEEGLKRRLEVLIQARKYEDAVTVGEKLLAKRETTYGPMHPMVAESLAGLGRLHFDLGAYAEARAFYEKALVVLEEVHGKAHLSISSVLNNLAQVQVQLGRYDEAEELFRRALEISEGILGKEDPRVATIMNNLGAIYYSIGDYGKAEEFFKRALRIVEKKYGPEHPEVAAGLNNLAEVYSRLWQYGKAVKLYERSLVITEKTLGPEHPQVATILNNLANYYQGSKQFYKAERFYERALAIREKVLGAEHPSLTKHLYNFGHFYSSVGEYESAKPLLERALTIAKRSFGPNHPAVAKSLQALALMYAHAGDYENAFNFFTQVHHVNDRLIDQVMGFTSDEQKHRFLAMNRWNLFRFFTIVVEQLNERPKARTAALNVWLRRKGVILEAQRRFQEALIYSDDSRARETFQNLARVRSELSRHVFAGPGAEGIEAHKKKIEQLEAEEAMLEARLSRQSQSFALARKREKADCENVAKSLPPKTVLIEFARVLMADFELKDLGWKLDGGHYLAFVLHAGKGANVQLLDLGDASEVDETIAQFKRSLGKKDPFRSEADDGPSRRLYDLVFAPIRKKLGEVKEIFISPDGNLSLIPFEIMKGPDGRFLIEDYTLNYLGAGRDVLGFGRKSADNEKALLMGDPDFDLGLEERVSILEKLGLRSLVGEDTDYRSPTLTGLHFSRLPHTRVEVARIRELLGERRAAVYTGKQALEDVLRHGGSPRILHLATHGFFLEDLPLGSPVLSAGIRGIKEIDVDHVDRESASVLDPLLRSGFALAGANRALLSGNPKESQGIVTAEKILGMNLHTTDMVVLSGCETGLGDVQMGQGVFGLRRAFSQAGAKSMVMSMWSVPDRETTELMVTFYKNLVSGELNRCQALRRAALREMEIARERYGHASPFLWGAFVFVGEP